MKWILFFSNFDGRISRKTFWLTGLAVFIGQILIAVVVAVASEAMANEAAGDMAMDIVLFIFLYPQFVISVKRGHDRGISTWVIGIAYVLLALFDVTRFAGWLQTNPNQNTLSSASLISFAFILIVGVVSLALIIELGFRRGTPGPNRYGPDRSLKPDGAG
jgi:uncharacterized membrane protein YhaH (DUF805 family)